MQTDDLFQAFVSVLPLQEPLFAFVSYLYLEKTGYVLSTGALQPRQAIPAIVGAALPKIWTLVQPVADPFSDEKEPLRCFKRAKQDPNRMNYIKLYNTYRCILYQFLGTSLIFVAGKGVYRHHFSCL